MRLDTVTRTGATVTERRVLVRRGRHFGWWVEGRKASGGLFIKTWWPTEGLARAIAGLVGGETEPSDPDGGSSP